MRKGKKQELNYRSPLAGLKVSREPEAPKLPDYDPEFLRLLNNRGRGVITDTMFDAALRDRLAAEDYSYTIKMEAEARLANQMNAELETIGEEKKRIVNFLDYLNNRNDSNNRKEPNNSRGNPDNRKKPDNSRRNPDNRKDTGEEE